MTYTEWRDELKNNLLSVSENERRRVLDYYAEAYADRREAGFSEHEIIEDFGAPYDAAQRILCDRSDYSDDFFDDRQRREDDRRRREDDRRRREDDDRYRRRDDYSRDDERDKSCAEPEDKSESFVDSIRGNRLLFVLLCLVFAGPLFGILMAMVGITIGLCVAPFAVLVSGAGIAASGIVAIIGGEIFSGLGTLGIAFIVIGIGIILMSVFTKIVKLLWKLWNDFFKWLKSLFGIKEKEKAK